MVRRHISIPILFIEYYSFLKFDVTVANVYAQLTLVKLNS